MKYRSGLLLIIICTFLQGCGEYGPLYLPEQHHGGVVGSEKTG